MSEFDFDTPSGSTSTFPRPTSLFQPERFTPSLLDSSSYSPFPTVAGSRHDPFGLDAYLLHPGDQIWDSINPSSIIPDQSGIIPLQEDKLRMGGLKKMKSNNLLRKGSPLSQSSTMLSPPPPSALALPMPEQTAPRRRRSQSMSSTSSGTMNELKEEVVVAAKTGSVGKKGFSRLFGRRKSISSLPPPPPVVEVLPPVPSLAPAFTPSSSSTSLSTPPPGLENGSTTSSNSSLAPRTPRDSPSQSTDSLTEALAKAEVGEEGVVKKKGLMGWLGRRTSKMPSTPNSANSSPISSPNPSLTNLTTPSTPPLSTDPVSRINPSPEQQPYAWVGDQMRRASYRKLAQLRRPSPHPLAQQLRRQTSHLPNEVASSFEVGQILYPRSINPRDPHSGLTPAQRGLWCLLGVKIVLDQLDLGGIPEGTITKRPPLPSHSSERKARGGMKDFINRPPFEDRYLVFYPEETWSPVSMARPGFGVWDLDFSKYILALADSGEVESTPWPNLPRPSFLAIDGMRTEVVEEEEKRAVVEITEDGEMFSANDVLDTARATKAGSIDSTTSDDSANTTASSIIINTPSVLDGSQVIPEIKIDFDETDIGQSREMEAAFRRKSRVIQQTWDESDEEDEDIKPLSSIGGSRQLPQSSGGMKVSTSVPNVREAPKAHTRRSSQPIPSISQIPSSSSTSYLAKRRSQFDTAYDDERRQQKAMEEVIKARERRQALHSGEVDRKAEGEQRRKEEAKRRSVASTTAVRPQSTGGASGKRSSVLSPGAGEDQRQRTKSFGPETSSSRGNLGQTKRYHSFYEVPTHNPSPVTSPSIPQMFNHNQIQYQPHPHPGMVHSNSMGNFIPTMSPPNMAMPFYPQPMGVHPIYYPSPMQFGYPNHPSQMYNTIPSVHPGMPNSHSSMSISDQQRRARQRASYA